MSTTDPNKRKRRTTILLPPEVGESARRFSNTALLRIFRHLNSPISTSSTPPTEAQHRLVITGFILGVFSIVTSFLYICGLLASICGLGIGIYAYRKSPALHLIASWTIGLSVAGLLISLLFAAISLHR